MIVNKVIKTTEPVEISVTDVTLLTEKEAKALPERLRLHHNWWWLRSSVGFCITAACVSIDGSVFGIGRAVDDDDVAIRPALRISGLESSGFHIGDIFEFGGTDFEVVSGDTAFCLGDIGDCCFRKDVISDDVDDFEKSDVRKYIDRWFEQEKNFDNWEKSKTCCFTGHRPKRLGIPENEVREWLETQIDKAISDGFTGYISGTQRGVDIWAAEAVLKKREEGKGIRLICTSPWKGVENIWDQSWKDRYKYIMENADEVYYVSTTPSRRSFFERNHWMVDHSSMLIAVFTGAPGGTLETVRYAEKKGLEIRLI